MNEMHAHFAQSPVGTRRTNTLLRLNMIPLVLSVLQWRFAGFTASFLLIPATALAADPTGVPLACWSVAAQNVGGPRLLYEWKAGES